MKNNDNNRASMHASRSCLPLFNEFNLKNLQGDLFGGLTAAIIALPMALAFGVASGAGPVAGLYGAILVGLFASLFGSTPTLISEPTGPMTVIMTAVIANLIASNPEQGMSMAFTVVMLAGMFQILFGVMKLGNYVTMMPYTVVSGFMTGIGIILIILQLGPMIGHATPPGGVLGTVNALPELFRNIKQEELLLGALTFFILVLYPAKFRKYLPPQLIALVVGTLASVLFFSQTDIREIGAIPKGLPDIHLPVFTTDHWRLMILDAVVLAVLGSIDALLTSVIAENLTHKEGNSNKDLVGQGIGNLASGLFGGIPGAGATMGTVLNIQTGGRTALSGLSRALLLIVVLAWAGDLAADIPLAVLAGIALKVGIDIIDWSFLRRAHRVSGKAALIMYAVIGLTVFVDLITAVAVGVFVANILTIERMIHIQQESIRTIHSGETEDSLSYHEQTLLEGTEGKVLVFALGGPLFFGMAKAISRKYAVLSDHEVLIMDFTDVPTLGVSSSLALETLILADLEQGRDVYIVGAHGEVEQRLEQLGILDAVHDDHIIDTRKHALEQAAIAMNEKRDTKKSHHASS
jgi:SulP family sulfate permease